MKTQSLRWVFAAAASCSAAAGCAGSVPSGGVPVRAAFEGGGPAAELSIRRDPSPLAARKFVPVYHPPEIFPVYVPSRVSRARDVLVGEHWIFIKLSDGGWFPEFEGEPADPHGPRATEEDLRRLRRGLAETPFEEAIRR